MAERTKTQLILAEKPSPRLVLAAPATLAKSTTEVVRNQRSAPRLLLTVRK